MGNTAQQLLFAHTTSGDITPLLSGYYDTVNAGMKQVPQSYSTIFEDQEATLGGGLSKEEWLFFSDNVKEVQAAEEAGMRAVVLVRPGNAELSEEDKKDKWVVESFDEVEI